MGEKEIMDTKNFEWATFLQPYEFAVTNFLTKLQFIKKQYTSQGIKNPIEDITGRVKSPASIMEKLERLNMNFDDVRDLTDIAGIRITCKYIQERPILFSHLELRFLVVDLFLYANYLNIAYSDSHYINIRSFSDYLSPTTTSADSSSIHLFR